MALPEAKITSHTIELSFTCPTEQKDTGKIVVTSPSIYNGKYFDDWEYTYIFVQCPLCGQTHKIII